ETKNVMDIRIISVGHLMPEWVEVGFKDYEKRLPKHQIKLSLTEISPSQKRTPQEIKMEEAKKIIKHIETKTHQVIVLDKVGKELSSEILANKLASYQDNRISIALIIGGAFGLDETLKEKANECWSLGALTLPHMLV